MILTTEWIAPTMNHLSSTAIPFLMPFAILFQLKKNFVKMLLFFVGGVICRGGRTVCGCLRAVGTQGEAPFANYHHLLNRCKVDMLKSVKLLIEMILPLTDTSVMFVVDEERRDYLGVETQRQCRIWQ